MKMKNPGRWFGQVVKLKKDRVDEYKACHAKVWPDVLKQIKDCGIEDCKLTVLPPSYSLIEQSLCNGVIDSIFYDDGLGLLFASFKYIGYDYAGDMEKMAGNPKVREWWKMTDGMQESLVEGAVSSEAGTPSWWRPMEQVFFQP
jgi:L-rhamnose mutarotase